MGMFSSHESNLMNWKNSDPQTRGEKPSEPKAGHCYPVLYRDRMFDRTGDYSARIKIYRNETWSWIEVELRKADVDYVRRNCSEMKECAPTLMKRGKEWFLDFPFQQSVKLSDVKIRDQVILAVSLGMKNPCTCTVMDSGGRILGREFLKLSEEQDELRHRLGKIKKARRCGSKGNRRLWAYARAVNDDMALKTAKFIIDKAVLYDVDCIVFEHLSLDGPKPGPVGESLNVWKARTIQKQAEHQAHANGIRVSHVNAWGTALLAYDGSGETIRGDKAGLGSRSLCRFTGGKTYNVSLNASMNVGARYFVREILKTLPARERQRIEVKIPECAKRSTCTLATLISLNGELGFADPGPAV